MDFVLVIGLHEDWQGRGITHFSGVRPNTNEVWLYLSEDAIVNGVISGTHMYTGEPFADSIMDWVFFALNHEVIHMVCRAMGEDSRFDPICGLGPEGL